MLPALVKGDGSRMGACSRTLAAAGDHGTVEVYGSEIGREGGEEDGRSSNAVVMDQLLRPGKGVSAAGTAA